MHCATAGLLLVQPSYNRPEPLCHLLLLPPGIVGIAAAALGAHVMLTDTRDILPQVYENVQQNSQLIEASGGSATVAELDWNEPDDEVGITTVNTVNDSHYVIARFLPMEDVKTKQ